MSIRRKLKRTTKQYIIVVSICIFVMGGAAVITSILITEQIKERYSALLTEARQEIETNKRTVYIATADIAVGDYITKDNIKVQNVYATQPLETYITADDIGKVALIDVTSGTQLLKGMLTENHISSELRELEYSVINISSNIADSDTVDIRISYPNGESYIVLSKKVIKGFTPEKVTCYLWLTEEEHLRMSAAIVDASLYSGAKLYVSKYIEPSIQESSIVNYVPSLSVISLLESDPNIIEKSSQELSKNVRKALENRLADSLATDVSAISWDVQNIPVNDTNTPTPIPEPVEVGSASGTTGIIKQEETVGQGTEELGNKQPAIDYYYYAEEQEAMGEDVEYGE